MASITFVEALDSLRLAHEYELQCVTAQSRIYFDNDGFHKDCSCQRYSGNIAAPSSRRSSKDKRGAQSSADPGNAQRAPFQTQASSTSIFTSELPSERESISTPDIDPLVKPVQPDPFVKTIQPNVTIRASRVSQSHPIFFQQSTAESLSMSSLHRLRKLVTSVRFEVTFSTIIVLNALVMAAEVQYIGIDIGYDLHHPKANAPASEAWPGALEAFRVFGEFFGVCFTIELVLKVIGLRTEFLWDCWNYLDILIVLFWILDFVGKVVFPVDTMILRVARLARLLRIVRGFKSIKGCDSLLVLTTAVQGSTTALKWAIVFLLVIQIMIAMLVHQILSDGYLVDDSIPTEDRLKIYEYFGTFARSLLSTFEMTLANWPPICRLLSEQVSEWFMVLCVVHKLTVGFAVIGVINGVFMQETFKVTANDDQILVTQKERAMRAHKKKMEMLFELSGNENGLISLAEFQRVLSKPNVQTWLGSMELEVTDIRRLHSLLDEDDNGAISVDELISGCARLKGPAKSLELATLRKEVRAIAKFLKRNVKNNGLPSSQVCSSTGIGLLPQGVPQGMDSLLQSHVWHGHVDPDKSSSQISSLTSARTRDIISPRDPGPAHRFTERQVSKATSQVSSAQSPPRSPSRCSPDPGSAASQVENDNEAPDVPESQRYLDSQDIDSRVDIVYRSEKPCTTPPVASMCVPHNNL